MSSRLRDLQFSRVFTDGRTGRRSRWKSALSKSLWNESIQSQWPATSRSGNGPNRPPRNGRSVWNWHKRPGFESVFGIGIWLPTPWFGRTRPAVSGDLPEMRSPDGRGMLSHGSTQKIDCWSRMRYKGYVEAARNSRRNTAFYARMELRAGSTP